MEEVEVDQVKVKRRRGCKGEEGGESEDEDVGKSQGQDEGEIS